MLEIRNARIGNGFALFQLDTGFALSQLAIGFAVAQNIASDSHHLEALPTISKNESGFVFF